MVKKKKAIDLGTLFADRQKGLLQALETARRHIDHGGDKGSVGENEWISMLRSVLPYRYEVDKATVIDSANGATSESIDIVIYDRQYSPLVFEQAGFKYIAAEAVYAVFEAKQVLNPGYIDYAAKKAASVRRLKRTSTAVTDIRGDTPAKSPIAIIAGLLATDIGWKRDPAAHVLDYCTQLDDIHNLDFVCAAHSFAFELSGEPGQRRIDSSSPKTGLMFFVLGLLQKLQRNGTVAPIDFLAYRSSLQRH